MAGEESALWGDIDTQILLHLSIGRRLQEIGHHVGRTQWTVSWHIRRMSKAIGAKTPAHLVALAMRRGIIK